MQTWRESKKDEDLQVLFPSTSFEFCQFASETKAQHTLFFGKEELVFYYFEFKKSKISYH